MLVGIGGGFDVFTGLPFVYNLPNDFVLVNSSPYGLFHYHESTVQDYPEGLIANRENIVKKYSVGRHGVMAVKKAYQDIIDKHQIDIVMAVDGGVDSLSTGDEENHGTILEDFIAIAALDEIKVDKILCCAGFGTETEENLNHYRVLENMASLIAGGFFIGSFSLTRHMPEFTEYLTQCEAVWENNRKSHIQTKIISAVLGMFGENNKYDNIDARVANATNVVFISPLASVYWMFDFEGVARHNKAISMLKTGNTFADSKIILRNFLNANNKTRSKKPLPI